MTIPAAADAKVSERWGDRNYGDADHLRIRRGEHESYVRFDVRGLNGSVSSAKLRMYVVDGGSDGGDVYRTSADWSEGSITWDRRPGPSGSRLVSMGSVRSGRWVEMDVTSAVSGNGGVSFLLRSGSSNSVFYASRETSTKPVLVVTTGSEPTPTPEPAPDPTPQPAVATFAAAADAKVSERWGDRNYGDADHLRIRRGEHESYVRFDVRGISGRIVSAKLHLFVTDGGPDGGDVYATAAGWSESRITWDSRPSASGSRLASLGAVEKGRWVEIDVTGAVSGDGAVSFLIRSDSSNSVFYASRETSTRPTLVVTTT